jgi:hypothetical protein
MTNVAALMAGSVALSAALTVQAQPLTEVTTEYIATLSTPLEAPQAIGSGLLVFHPRPGGRLDGSIRAEVLPPSGDWVRVMPNGSMRIDVRLTARLDDGELLYMTYGGILKKPDADSWDRFMKGEKIVSPQWYYVVTPNFETSSKKYGWLNDLQAIGKFVSIQTGPQAHVTFDIYAVR